MSEDASLGVLIPTRNSAALLPNHLRSLAPWLDLADQVVVVDSFSTDGTRELLRQGLKHAELEFVSHPPGLYASWNAGFQRLKTRYTYIATVGDTISRAGLRELLDTALHFDADVVISKPAFRKPDGVVVQMEWPIDDIVRTLGINAPRQLHRLEAAVFACTHANAALTGSCASDLFRTEVLRRFPFPTEFGTAGDGVWSVQHAARLAWAVAPGCFSRFLLHRTSVSQAENQPEAGAPRLDVILLEAAEGWCREGLVSEEDLERIGWNRLSDALSRYLDAKTAFDSCRHSKWPWSLNPSAWRARFRRERRLAELRAWKEFALQSAQPGSRPEVQETPGGSV